MSTTRARFEQRAAKRAGRNADELARIIAAAVFVSPPMAAEIAQVVIAAGYRRKRPQRDGRDGLHLAVASCGDDEDGAS